MPMDILTKSCSEPFLPLYHTSHTPSSRGNTRVMSIVKGNSHHTSHMQLVTLCTRVRLFVRIITKDNLGFRNSFWSGWVISLIRPKYR